MSNRTPDKNAPRRSRERLSRTPTSTVRVPSTRTGPSERTERTERSSPPVPSVPSVPSPSSGASSSRMSTVRSQGRRVAGDRLRGTPRSDRAYSSRASSAAASSSRASSARSPSRVSSPVRSSGRSPAKISTDEQTRIWAERKAERSAGSSTRTARSSERSSRVKGRIPVLDMAKGTEGKEIVLRENQPQHVEDLKAIYSKYPVAASISVMGAGKSFISGHIFQRFGFRGMLVLGPAGSRHTWEHGIIQEYGINGQFITYGELAGKGDAPLKHNYLIRINPTRKGGKTKYAVTDDFKYLVENRLLLVIDESQKSVGDSLSNLAVNAMMNYLVKQALDRDLEPEFRRSRAILLSGTPFQNEDQVFRVIKLTGIMTETHLYRKDPKTGAVKLGGLKEIADTAIRLDPELANAILNDYPVDFLNPTLAKALAVQLFLDIIGPSLTASMVRAETETIHPIVNKYFKLTGADLRKYSSGVEALKVAANVRHDVIDGEDVYTVEYNQRSIGNLSRALSEIEGSKVNAIVRDVKRILDEVEGSKAIIVLYNLVNITRAMDLLSDYNPVKMIGETKSNRKSEIQTKFQEDSDDIRVLITQIQVGGVSMSFHDIHGGRPRFMWITPRYSAIESAQAAGRVDRVGSQTDSMVMFVYAQGSVEESKILSALANKSKIMRKGFVGEAQEQLLLPDEYPSVLEGEEEKYEIYFD